MPSNTPAVQHVFTEEVFVDVVEGAVDSNSGLS